MRLNLAPYVFRGCLLGVPLWIGCAHSGNPHELTAPVAPAQPATSCRNPTPPAAPAFTSSSPPAPIAMVAPTPATNPSLAAPEPVQSLPALANAVADASLRPASHEEEGPATAAPVPSSPPVAEQRTVSPWFSHSEDYQCLRGQVELSRLSHSCRLRFASMDEEEPHGGTVTLIGDSRLRGLKDGQYVKVCGHLINADDKGTAPAYHVEAFEIIDRPE